MPTIEELHERAQTFLCRANNHLPVKPPTAAAADREPEIESLGGTDGGTFLPFLPAHHERAMELVARLMELAQDRGVEEGLAAVLETVEAQASEENMELLRYALLVFITHHPDGRRLPIPPLAARTPEMVTPSHELAADSELEVLGGLGAEALLDYFREDTGFNDHHLKWHVVNPFGGVPDPVNPFGPRVTKDRQGELFWYMHQQMLARYDTERIAVGLDRVEPLEDYRAPIAEGYDANLPGFSNRRPDETLRDVALQPGLDYTVDQHEDRRDRHLQAAQDGFYRIGGAEIPMTPDLVGSTLEANLSSAEGSAFGNPFSFYGNQHNFGHVLLSELADPTGPNPNSPGVMASTATAVRDPVFYRWHRHVDDLFFVWQDRLPENDFSTGAPPVLMRQEIDLILCKTADVPGADQDDFDGDALGEATFGGAQWDEDPTTLALTTSELVTTMKTELLPGGIQKPYLDHEDYLYFFRLKNRTDQEQKVTVRVFLAATDLADDRRSWIEMDKFAQRLEPNQRKVVYRSARQSAVVRKPARHPDEPLVQLPPGAVDRNYCDCGWPYHLLLPRGREVGMGVRLLVMLTDWEQDLVGAERKCGSMSFCGARDADYPDSRPMGFPFDRPFTSRSIVETVAAHENWASRDFTIRHEP